VALDTSASHVGLPNSFDLLHSLILTYFVKGSKNFIKDINNLVLALVHDICEITNIAEHHGDFADIVGHEILLKIR
jgi:hypothetical protein